jgi:hypothetical protein
VSVVLQRAAEEGVVMCVILAVHQGLPTRAELMAAERANRDGAGVAWLKGGAVHWRKGLTGEEVACLIEDGRVRAPALIHFRIATVGGALPALTHPFPVTRTSPLDLEGTAPAVLAHNGHWGGWRSAVIGMRDRGHEAPGGAWSDSRAMAWAAGVYGHHILDFIAPGQRIATLTVRGLKLYGYWKRQGGISYSNRNFADRCEYEFAPAAGEGEQGTFATPRGYVWIGGRLVRADRLFPRSGQAEGGA